MSKRIARQRKRTAEKPEPEKTRKPVVVLCSLLILTLIAAVMAQWNILPGISRPLAPAPAPSSSFNANSPSKEYIYAGGRLIATEEPTNGNSSLAAPAALSATTISGAQINLSWTVASGAVDHYQVERSQSLNGPFTMLSPNPTSPSFIDNTVTSGTAYLYRVKAVDASGNASIYSNLDLATAINFTDDPLLANTTVVKAQHLIELRQAINAVRALAGLPASSWTDPSPQGAFIKKVHIEELRASLDQALAALGLPVQPYTDPTLTTRTFIKKVHFHELRERVK
jgi:hypothetical protein